MSGNHGITDRMFRILSFHGQGHFPQAQVAPGHSGIPGFSEVAKGPSLWECGSLDLDRSRKTIKPVGDAAVSNTKGVLKHY